MNFTIENFIFNYYNIGLLFIFILLIFNYKNILLKINNNIKYLLLISRSLLLTILLFIFINPIIIKKNTNQHNVSFIIDNSKSMLYNFDNINVNYKTMYEKIDRWIEKNNIIPKFYVFGEEYLPVSNLQEITYDGLFTNINSMIESVNSNSIIITDGVNNYGKYNLNLKNKNNLNVIGIGKEKQINDMGIELEFSSIYDDSIRFNFKVKNNYNINLLNQNIYLSNSSINNYPIQTFDIVNDNYTFSISSNISKELIENNNIIHINKFKNETNYVNNSFIYTVDKDDLKEKNVLFISGNLSNNTKFIKNNLLTTLFNYEVSHYFRLNNDIWNTNIDKINFNDYNLIVLDNYPLYEKDNIILDNILSEYKNKIIFFKGSDNDLPNNNLY